MNPQDIFFNGYKFKQYFTPFQNYFYIIPVYTPIKNSQANTPVEILHQVIYNMIATKYLDIKVYDYINTWFETLTYISWSIRASYYHTLLFDTVK